MVQRSSNSIVGSAIRRHEAIVAVDGTQLVPLLRAVAVGDRLPDRVSIPEARMASRSPRSWAAAGATPSSRRTGEAITLPPPRDDLHVFHAGTARAADGTLVTAGGRVLAITAVAPTLAEAQRRSVDYLDPGSSLPASSFGPISPVGRCAERNGRTLPRMPELPEVETIARDVDAELRGALVVGARVRRADVLREVTHAAALRRRVAGARILRGWRRAKFIVIDLSTGDRLVVFNRASPGRS